MNIKIELMASERDMEGKGYVHWKSWQETYAGLVNEDYLARMSAEKCVAMAKRWPENTLVAKDGDKVIGFSCWNKSWDEDMPEAGAVAALYVLREYQGQGVGCALMNAAMEKLNGYDTVSLWVLRGNEKAIRFYERCGFVFDGTEKEIQLGTPNVERRMVHRKVRENQNGGS